MTSSEAVYQPTTVTYESENSPQQQLWSNQPISYISASVTQATHRPCGKSCASVKNVLPLVFLTSAIACFAIGLTMLIQGALGYNEHHTFYMLVSIVGILLLVVGFIFIVLFLKVTCCWCFRKSKSSALSTNSAQVLNVNPSTDLLVGTQYTAVTESEQSKLMPTEAKDE